ncbi:Mg/Co/Ni transporter MgtE (contains CBS domain) [Frankineae bacterium MT45]|nr:Mg/Co/Ni transporter MgtE (contains CBS domain) [Frankineae bacterium MT45]
MSVGTRVFIARLSGVGVFDPSGDQLGRIREAVATLRIGRQPPRVLGLVLEIQHRHRIFVPMGRVTRIEPDAVTLSSGIVNMKRFERRSSELLVLAEVLDRTVTTTDDQQAVSIVDAAMEQTRSGDWEITRLAVRSGGGRLSRRRGQLFQVAWDEVDGLALAENSQGTDTLLSVLAGLRPADVAAALQDMPAKRRLEVVAALDDERLADILEELPEDDQVSLLTSLADERAADVLEAMNDDDAADLLGEMATVDQERLLKLMEPDEAEPVRRLMTYGDYSAGGLMTTEPVILLPDATVAEALALVRNPDLSPALAAQVFVVRPPQATPTGKFLGTAHLQRLLREPPSALVSGLAERDTRSLRPNTPIADITRHLATYNLVAAPVIDENGRLLGAVSVDDVLDHLLPEDWRDVDAQDEHRETEAAAVGDGAGSELSGRHDG